MDTEHLKLLRLLQLADSAVPIGAVVLKREDLLDAVPEMLQEMQVEATFPAGNKLVTVHAPRGEIRDAPWRRFP